METNDDIDLSMIIFAGARQRETKVRLIKQIFLATRFQENFSKKGPKKSEKVKKLRFFIMGKPKNKEKDGRQNFNPSKSSTNPGMYDCSRNMISVA